MPSQIVNVTIQAVVMSATSNILAQIIKSWRQDLPFTFAIQPILQFAFFTALNTPPNFLWQQFLEETFPGYTVKPAIVTSEKPMTHEKTTEIVPEKKLDVKNTAIKFLLDQSVGSLFNTVAFIAGMAAIRGANMGTIMSAVQNDSWSLMSAGYKLWPAVSLLNFTVVPFQYRMLLGQIVGMGWGIFLSLLAG